MRVWTSKYRNHWISPYSILETICFWEKDKDRIYNLTEEDNNPYEPWVNFLDPICTAWMKFLDFVHPRWNYVRLDPWDTWSFDHTLADIILPGLRQLKATKHGAPHVDDADVPEHLRSTAAPPRENEWDIDDNHFRRWDWVLDEMIWAFEQKVTDDAESQFFDHSEVDQTAAPKLGDINERLGRIRYDKEGYQAWQQRKDNGFRLFGRYYEALWD